MSGKSVTKLVVRLIGISFGLAIALFLFSAVASGHSYSPKTSSHATVSVSNMGRHHHNFNNFNNFNNNCFNSCGFDGSFGGCFSSCGFDGGFNNCCFSQCCDWNSCNSCDDWSSSWNSCGGGCGGGCNSW